MSSPEWVHVCMLHLHQAKAKPSPLFRALETTWRFRALPAAAHTGSPRTQVDFTLTYAFSSPVHAAVAGQVFKKLSERMIEAFRQRSDALYRTR